MMLRYVLSEEASVPDCIWHAIITLVIEVGEHGLSEASRRVTITIELVGGWKAGDTVIEVSPGESNIFDTLILPRSFHDKAYQLTDQETADLLLAKVIKKLVEMSKTPIEAIEPPLFAVPEAVRS